MADENYDIFCGRVQKNSALERLKLQVYGESVL